MPTDKASSSATPPQKGERGGECNRTVCKNTDARMFNRSTRKYYCFECADAINIADYADAHAMYGGDLCVLDAPLPATPERATSATDLRNAAKSVRREARQCVYNEQAKAFNERADRLEALADLLEKPDAPELEKLLDAIRKYVEPPYRILVDDFLNGVRQLFALRGAQKEPRVTREEIVRLLNIGLRTTRCEDYAFIEQLGAKLSGAPLEEAPASREELCTTCGGGGLDRGDWMTPCGDCNGRGIDRSRPSYALRVAAANVLHRVGEWEPRFQRQAFGEEVVAADLGAALKELREAANIERDAHGYPMVAASERSPSPQREAKE